MDICGGPSTRVIWPALGGATPRLKVGENTPLVNFDLNTPLASWPKLCGWSSGVESHGLLQNFIGGGVSE